MPKLSRTTQESSIYSDSKSLLMVLAGELVFGSVDGSVDLSVVGAGVVDSVREVSFSS